MMISECRVVVGKSWNVRVRWAMVRAVAAAVVGLAASAAAQTVAPCTQNCASLGVSSATISAGSSGQVSVTFNQAPADRQVGGPDEIAAIAFTLQLSDRLTLANCTLDGDGLPAAVRPGPGLGNFRVVVENASCTAGRTHCLCGTSTPDAFVNIAVYGPNPLPAPGSGPVEIPVLPSGVLLTIDLAVAAGTPNGTVIPLHVLNEVTDASKPQFQAFLSVGDKDAVDQTCVPVPGTPPCTGAGAVSQIAITDGQVTVQGAACVGDCDGDGFVTVDEIVRMVNIALGQQPLSVCPAADGNGDGQVTVDEIVRAVNNALNGCGA